MRQTIIVLFICLLFGICDAWSDNGLTVSNLTIAKEGTAVLAIETDFEKDDFIGYQLNITLPKGLALVLNAGGKIVATSYTDLDIDGNVIASTDASTTYRLIASKMGNPRIPSGSYVLFSVTIESDGSIDVGNSCECMLTNIIFSDSRQQKTEAEDVAFNVVVSDKVVLDENSPVVPTATDDEVDILVKRTIKANQWSTICLPFDMTEEQLYDAFGDDVQLAEFDTDEGYTVDDNGNIEVHFLDWDLSEGLWANYPYLIKTSANISEFEVEAQIVPDEGEAIAEYKVKRKTVGYFTGTLHAGTVIPEENLFLSGNKFYYSVGKTVSKAFRGYFWLKDVLPDLDTANARISMNVEEGEVTGIRLQKRSATTQLLFDLQGRHVSNPERGLYIYEGRKVIIK